MARLQVLWLCILQRKEWFWSQSDEQREKASVKKKSVREERIASLDRELWTETEEYSQNQELILFAIILSSESWNGCFPLFP